MCVGELSCGHFVCVRVGVGVCAVCVCVCGGAGTHFLLLEKQAAKLVVSGRGKRLSCRVCASEASSSDCTQPGHRVHRDIFYLTVSLAQVGFFGQ